MGTIMSERRGKGGRWLAWAGMAVLAGVVLGAVVRWNAPGPSAFDGTWRDYLALNSDYAGWDAAAREDLKAMAAGPGTAAQEGKWTADLGRYFAERAVPLPAKVLTALPDWNAETRRTADEALRDVFTFQGVTAQVPRLANGGLDWNWGGPNHDPEFTWFLNRMTMLPALYVAWKETGEEKYRKGLQGVWLDWLEHNPRPGHYSLSGPWRALETARRVQDAWLPILFDKGGWAAVTGSGITPGMLLMSLKQHAECLRDTHAPYGNHLISEMAGLAMVALAFPEFKDAPGWLDDAVTTAQQEAVKQFYPDGAHTELTNEYQLVVLLSLQSLMDMLLATGHAEALEQLRPALENGWNYFAYVTGPRGYGPVDNDSDEERNALWVRAVAPEYGRSDWEYVATNGKEGTAPPGWGSEYFPWAGQAVMRSGWRASDQWAFFDVGPFGSDHQHEDRLQLDVSGEGREFLVDNGRYTYQPGAWRDYFAGPTGHNVMLLDGRGPMRPPDVSAEPGDMRQEMKADRDFFSATVVYAGNWLTGQGPAYHTRAVLYARGKYWIVADRVLTAGGPRRLDALWHFHPECVVKSAGDLIYTDDAKTGNLGLLAVNAPRGGWGVELVSGREGAAPQGWYSAVFHEKVPATCADLSATVTGPGTYAWVMWTEPAGKDVTKGRPAVTVEEDSAARLRLKIAWPDGKVDAATVPFDKGVGVEWGRVAGN